MAYQPELWFTLPPLLPGVPRLHLTSLDNGIWLLINSWCLRDKCQDAPSPAPSISSQWHAAAARDLAHQELNLLDKEQNGASQKHITHQGQSWRVWSFEAPASAGAEAVMLWGTSPTICITDLGVDRGWEGHITTFLGHFPVHSPLQPTLYKGGCHTTFLLFPFHRH